MEITQHPGANALELRLTGRLDATWAEHVSRTIETAVRAGSHQIVLNFAGVQYISSLGIQILVSHYKRLKAVKGSLTVTEPNEVTRTILKAVGLAGILLGGAEAATAAAKISAKQVTRGSAVYEVYPQAGTVPLSCRFIGEPEKLRSGGFSEVDCRPMTFANGSFGLGLGAFGEGFADCRNRFGEFLAAGGCAITLPTNDMHALPDYVVEEGVLVPRVETLYALAGSGDFSSMVRFDATTDGPGKVGLSELVDALIELSGAEIAAFVVLAEAAGLVGATLRRSAAAGPVSLSLPGVRDWLSFTTERSSERSLALLVGVAARTVPGDASAFLRPMKADSPVQAHIHAAVFPYRPVQRGELPFRKSITEVFASSTPSAVMHVMADTRPFEGVGETDLVRGACWLGPLQTISRG
jgi:anti-anti-sigma factor